MNESNSSRRRELRVGERVRLGARVGVLRYLYGTGAAVVRFDHDPSTKVVPLRRLVAATDERPLPDPEANGAQMRR
jgi:hypothetical protein